MNRAALLLPLALLAAACPRSPGEEGGDPVKDLRERVLASSQALATVRSLTDEAGPRLSGSPGFKAGVAWALRTLGEAGFARVHAEPCAVPHWERGDEGGEMIVRSPSRSRSPWPPSAAACSTPPEGLEAEVIEAPSIDALDKLDPAAVAGKIVFVYVRMERTRDGAGYGVAVKPRGQGPVHAARLGAAGVLIRSAGTDENRTPHTGSMRYDDKVRQDPPPPRWPTRTRTCSTGSSPRASGCGCG